MATYVPVSEVVLLSKLPATTFTKKSVIGGRWPSLPDHLGSNLNAPSTAMKIA